MNDFISSAEHHQHGRRRGSDGADEDSIPDSDFLFGDNQPEGNGIVTYAPKERFRLGYFDVCCLVINRMIGRLEPLLS